MYVHGERQACSVGRQTKPHTLFTCLYYHFTHCVLACCSCTTIMCFAGSCWCLFAVIVVRQLNKLPIDAITLSRDYSLGRSHSSASQPACHACHACCQLRAGDAVFAASPRSTRAGVAKILIGKSFAQAYHCLCLFGSAIDYNPTTMCVSMRL